MSECEYLCESVGLYVHVSVCVRVCVHAGVYNRSARVRTSLVYACTCVGACVKVYVCACVCVRICVYVWVYAMFKST